MFRSLEVQLQGVLIFTLQNHPPNRWEFDLCYDHGCRCDRGQLVLRVWLSGVWPIFSKFVFVSISTISIDDNSRYLFLGRFRCHQTPREKKSKAKRQDAGQTSH